MILSFLSAYMWTLSLSHFCTTLKIMLWILAWPLCLPSSPSTEALNIQYPSLPAQTAFHSPILSSSLAMVTPCSMSILSCLPELVLPRWTFFSCGGFFGVRRDLRWMWLPSEEKNPTYCLAFAHFHIGWLNKINHRKLLLTPRELSPIMAGSIGP